MLPRRRRQDAAAALAELWTSIELTIRAPLSAPALMRPPGENPARRTPGRSLAAEGSIATTGGPADGGTIGARAVQCNGLLDRALKKADDCETAITR